MNNEMKDTKLGAIFLLLAGIGFGTSGYFISKLTALGASTYLTAFASQFFAILPSLIILLIFYGTKGLKISKNGLIAALVMGILTKAVFIIAYSRSIALVGVSTAAILLYISPIFTAILSRIIFKEKLKNYQYLALALNILGSILVITKGNFSDINISKLGIALGLLVAFLYALNTIIGKVITGKDNPMTLTFYTILFATIATIFFENPLNSLEIINKEFILWGSLFGLISGSLANLFFYMGVSKGVKASKVPVICSVEVIAATLIAVFLLGEYMNLIGLLGIIIVLGSIVLMNYDIESKTKTI